MMCTIFFDSPNKIISPRKISNSICIIFFIAIKSYLVIFYRKREYREEKSNIMEPDAWELFGEMMKEFLE